MLSSLLHPYFILDTLRVPVSTIFLKHILASSFPVPSQMPSPWRSGPCHLSCGRLVQQAVPAFSSVLREAQDLVSVSLCFCFLNFSKEVILSSLFSMGSLSQSTVPSWGSPVRLLLGALIWYQLLLSLLPFVYCFVFITFSVNNYWPCGFFPSPPQFWNNLPQK